MRGAAALESSRAARLRSQRDRERRRVVLEAARRVRTQSRRLRDSASERRERALEQRWDLWTRGWRVAAPELVPLSWERDAGLGVPDRAAAEISRTARMLRGLLVGGEGELPPQVVSRLPAVIALCEATADRLADRDATASAPLVGISARALDVLEAALEAALETAAPGERAVLVAAACRTASRTMRRTLLHLHAHGTAP